MESLVKGSKNFGNTPQPRKHVIFAVLARARELLGRSDAPFMAAPSSMRLEFLQGMDVSHSGNTYHRSTVCVLHGRSAQLLNFRWAALAARRVTLSTPPASVLHRIAHRVVGQALNIPNGRSPSGFGWTCCLRSPIRSCPHAGVTWSNMFGGSA